MPLLVANNNDGCKAKTATTLHHAGDAADRMAAMSASERLDGAGWQASTAQPTMLTRNDGRIEASGEVSREGTPGARPP